MIKILVPIGTSPHADQTLQYALAVAAYFTAEIYVMDVFSVSTSTGSLGRVEEKVAKSSKLHLKELISKVDTKDLDIKIATYNGDIIDGLIGIDKELGIDLLIMAPRSNDIREELYLGHTSGRIVKQTEIPALVAPKGTTFQPLDKPLTAIGPGIVNT